MPKTSSIRLPAGMGHRRKPCRGKKYGRGSSRRPSTGWRRPGPTDDLTVPVDGLWVDDLWYFGGSPQAIHQRNLRTNSEIVVHLSDAMKAVSKVSPAGAWCRRPTRAVWRRRQRPNMGTRRRWAYLGHMGSWASSCPGLDQLSATRRASTSRSPSLTLVFRVGSLVGVGPGLGPKRLRMVPERAWLSRTSGTARPPARRRRRCP